MSRLIFLILILQLMFATPSYAQQSSGGSGKASRPVSRVTEQQFERVRKCARLLSDIKSQSMNSMMAHLRESATPEEHLQIIEAIAQTYVQLVRDLEIAAVEDKESLYDMITLNMAFLQMGGVNPAEGEARPLNRLILRTLRKHLSQELISDSNLFYKLE